MIWSVAGMKSMEKSFADLRKRWKPPIQANNKKEKAELCN